MTHDVFISYSSRDKAVADALCAALEQRQVRCWMAPRDISPGAEWGGAISEAIAGGRAFVLIFSDHSNRSQQVVREVGLAVSKGLVIIPFRLEDVPLTSTMEYFISTCHWLDALTPPLEAHLEKLTDTVCRLLRDEPAATAPATPEGTPAAQGALQTDEAERTRRAAMLRELHRILAEQVALKNDEDTFRTIAAILELVPDDPTALGAQGQLHARFASELDPLLASRQPAQRSEAIGRIRSAGVRSHEAALRVICRQDPDPGVRFTAWYALNEWGTATQDDLIAQLTANLRSSDRYQRRGAVNQVKEFEVRALLPQVRERAEQDVDEDVRMRAVDTLTALGEDISGVLRAWLASKDAKRQEAAVNVAQNADLRAFEPDLHRLCLESPDPGLRFRAWYALNKWEVASEEDFLAQLAANLGSSDHYQRRGAVNQVKEFQVQALAPQVRERATQDPDEDVRMRAVEALQALGKDISGVLRAWLASKDAKRQEAAVNVAQNADLRAFEPDLHRLCLEADDSGLRFRAWYALNKWEVASEEDLVAQLAANLGSSDHYQRRGAVNQVKEFQVQALVPQVRERATQDLDDGVRMGAFEVLVALGADPTEVITEWLGSDRETWRQDALRAIRQTGRREWEPHLRQQVTSARFPAVAQEARRLLEEWGCEVDEAFAAWLTAADPALRARGVQEIARRGIEQHVDVLRRLLRGDPSLAVRQEVLKALDVWEIPVEDDLARWLLAEQADIRRAGAEEIARRGLVQHRAALKRLAGLEADATVVAAATRAQALLDDVAESPRSSGSSGEPRPSWLKGLLGRRRRP